MQYTIRPLTKADIAQVVAMEATYLGETLGVEMLHNEIDNPVVTFLVIEIKDQVIGYIGGYFYQQEGEILNFVIHGLYQRQGLGQALWNELITRKHPKRITLEVRQNNLNAIAFYQKNGFQQITVRKHYYQDGTDALVMIREYI